MTDYRDANFDHHSPDFASGIPEIYEELHSKCPVVHSEQHGGFYAVARYDDVVKVARDPETFSSENDVDGTGNGGQGVLHPRSEVRIGFLEMDPPQTQKYRRLIMEWMSPEAIARYEDRMRELIVERIERVKEMGEFDVVDDLAIPIPALVTLDFMGLPLDNWELYARPIHEQTYVDRSTPAFEKVTADIIAAQHAALEFIAARREDPGDDLVSRLLAADIDGEPLSAQTIVDQLWLIMGGGFDTTAGLIAHVMRYLTERPDERRRLMEQPELLSTACEEFIRHFSPSTTMCRTVTRATTLGDAELEPGDRIVLCWGAANHDPEKFDRPYDVVLDRRPNPHVGFGDGIHRCAGSRFARTEIRIFFEELFARLPNFAVRPGDAVLYPSVGVVTGFSKMPAVADATAE